MCKVKTKTRLESTTGTTGATGILIVGRTIMQPPRRGILSMSHCNNKTLETTKGGTAFRYNMSQVK